MARSKKVQKQITTAEPGRRERRRLETREKLYRAAMKLFAKNGYFGTSTENITDAADVGQGTFFNYFPTKAHVLLVLSEKQLDTVDTALLEAESGNKSIREILRRFIHDIVEELAPSHALTRSLLTVFVAQDDVRELMFNTMVTGRQTLAAIIAIGQERQEIQRDHSAPDLALTFQRSVLGTLLLWAMQSKGDLHNALDKALDDFWTIATAKTR